MITVCIVMESQREQKLASSKRNSQMHVYSQKAVRAKEALINKKLTCNNVAEHKRKDHSS